MIKIVFSLIMFLFALGGFVRAQERDETAKYVYEDNKRLVALVEQAASLVEKKGANAFAEFGVKDSRWLNDKHYIFVYDMEGVCVFHPIESYFIGRDLSKLKDMNGRQVIAMITDVGKNSRPDASGWVFYLWEQPWHIYLQWKGSYIRKAVAPGGKVYLVGSGLYNIKIEKSFVQQHVDSAAALILARGKEAAFAELSLSSSSLHIMGNYISVLAENGDIVVDPLFPNLDKKRNAMGFRDSTGRSFMKEMIKALRSRDAVWGQFIAPKSDPDRPTRQLWYLRSVVVGPEKFYVGMSFAPAVPVWMK